MVWVLISTSIGILFYEQFILWGPKPAWLDIMESPVSGNRGRARRIDAGTFEVTSSDTRDLSDADKLVVKMDGTMLRGFLRFESFEEGWALRLE